MAPRAPKPRTRSSSTQKGRPSKCTPAVMDAIVEGYASGLGRKAAAKAAGVDAASLFAWLARGRLGEQPYVDLLTRIEGARASVVEGLRGVVLDLAHSEDPHVAGTNARWLLERLDPDHYGRRQEVRTTGPDGGPVQVAVQPLIPTDQLLRLSPETRAAIARDLMGDPAPEDPAGS